ncbi:hypothetical protein L798_15384 [Zootermopsis nevadensis]|uniref:Uncharacterized protein n=1 Tax=Zootermopsis nevadensis TaxID=136037 RepID=A0A067R007_ZOONE|nr:hypothetical protein L798_15384 [Zootermopsis nevadensis]
MAREITVAAVDRWDHTALSRHLADDDVWQTKMEVEDGPQPHLQKQLGPTELHSRKHGMLNHHWEPTDRRTKRSQSSFPQQDLGSTYRASWKTLVRTYTYQSDQRK